MSASWYPCETPPELGGRYVPLQQHPIYATAMKAMGANPHWFVNGGDACPSFALIIERKTILGPMAMMARGPVFAKGRSMEDCRSLIVSLAQRLRELYRVVCFTPELIGGRDPLEGRGWLEAYSPATSTQIDLSVSTEALMQAMSGTWRNTLRKSIAQNFNWEVRSYTPGEMQWIFDAESAQARQKSYVPVPARFSKALLNSKNTTVFSVEEARSIQSFMVFVRFGPTVQYQIGWNSPRGRAMDAHRFLLWQAMLWYRDRGVRNLELDSIDTERTPGLARFKMGTGAQLVRLGSTWLHAPFSCLFAAKSGSRYSTVTDLARLRG